MQWFPPLRSGACDRGPENGAHAGASDLQASPLSEGDRESWVTHIKPRCFMQGATARCPLRRTGGLASDEDRWIRDNVRSWISPPGGSASAPETCGEARCRSAGEPVRAPSSRRASRSFAHAASLLENAIRSTPPSSPDAGCCPKVLDEVRKDIMAYLASHGGALAEADAEQMS